MDGSQQRNYSEAHSSNSCRNCPVWRKSAFANLNDQDLDSLDREKTTSVYARGECFSEKNQPAQEFYCLQSGSAKVIMIDPRSKTQSLVRLVEPGDMLGYRCLFSASVFRGTSSALTESVACRVSKDFAIQLIQREPKFALEMLRRMGREVAAAEYHHHSFCQKNVRERLAEALLILKDKFGESSDLGWRINTRLTRTEISNWIGSSRETVIRTLHDFSEEHLVRQSGDFLHIVNLPKLVEISGVRTEDQLPYQVSPWPQT